MDYSELANKNIKDLNYFKDIILAGNRENPITALDLRGNLLSTLPEWIERLDQIQTLYLSTNNFKEFPPVIFQLKNLQRLYIETNFLREIPEEIKKLKKLTFLYLNRNQIKEIPKSIYETNISHLSLSHNQIRYLPEDLNIMNRLQVLQAANNSIRKIPSSLKELPLKTLDLSNNIYIEKVIATQMKVDWDFLSVNPSITINILLENQDRYKTEINRQIRSVFTYSCLSENRSKPANSLNNAIRYDLSLQLNQDLKRNEQSIEIIEISNSPEVVFEQLAPVFIILEDATGEGIAQLFQFINELIKHNRWFFILSYEQEYPFLNSYNDYIQRFTTLDKLKSLILFNISEFDKIKDSQGYTPKKIVLKSLELKNIGHFEDTKIEFHKNLTCIIGLNGAGKTTIMRSLACAILGSESKEITEKIYIPVDHLLRIEKQEPDQRHYASNGKIVLTYEVETQVSSMSIEFETVGSVIMPETYKSTGIELLNKDLILKGMILGFPQSSNTYNPNKQVIFADTFPNYNDIISLKDQSSREQLEKFIQWLVNRLEKLPFLPEDEKTKEESKINNIFRIINDIMGLVAGENNISSQDNNEQAIKGYFELKGFTRTGGSLPELIVKTYDSPNGIPFSFISQGHKYIISWLGRMIQRLYEIYPEELSTNEIEKMAGVVIIDEVDASFHPLWQSRLLYKLSQKFKNIQFIVTTHSPLSVAGLDRDQILILDATHHDGTKEGRPSLIDTWVLTPDEILVKIFDTQFPEPTKKRTELENMLRQVEAEGKNEENTKRIEELKDDLYRLDISTVYQNKAKEEWIRYVESVKQQSETLAKLIEKVKNKLNDQK